MTKKKIEQQLSDEQWNEVHLARERWLAIGRSTDRVDRAEVEKNITGLYQKLGHGVPRFIWWSGPMAGCVLTPLLLAAMKIRGAQLDDQLDDQLRDQLDDQLRAQLGAQLDDQLDDQLRDQLDDQLRAQLGAQLGAQLRAQLRDQLDDQLRDQLDDQLRAQLDAQLRDQLRAQLDAQLGDQLRAQLGAQLRAQLDAQLGAQLRAQLRDQLDDQLRDQLDDQLRAQLDAQLRAQLDAQLGAQLRAQLKSAALRVRYCMWAQWWFPWTIGRAESVRCAGLEFRGDRSLLDTFLALMESCGQFAPFRDLVVCTDRPTTLSVDQGGRLHCETGPAVEYGDGWKLYYWHGTRVPEEWILDKGNLKPETALNWANVEQRRAAAEIIGWGKILDALKPIVIDEDTDPEVGTLLRCDLPESPREQFLRVRCGTGRDFVLPVPPDMTSALEANAWTYGLTPDEYKLEMRT